MDEHEGLGVGDVARISGVTVRTLHHYDSIGLLSPSGRTHARYLQYSDADIERLMAIVAYRACGLSLADIADVLRAAGPDRIEHLRRQIAILDSRLADLVRQRSTLNHALEARQMSINLDPEEYFAVFGDSDPLQYAQEAHEMWGDTDAYAESSRRTSQYTKADWQQAQDEAAAVVAEFVACLQSGIAADAPRAMDAAEAHRASISTWYYSCSHEMHVGLADMYLADPRFTSYYEDAHVGLAAYVNAAIYANALRRSEG